MAISTGSEPGRLDEIGVTRTDRFRADIEGLRALAIFPILIFHLDPALIPGGFAGVDIFFVISGYLISWQILRSGAEGFRFLPFYIRRIRRLFPALAVTVAVSLAVGWRLLTPSDFVALAKSALASLAGAANIYFYASVDYFAESTLLHPLLHVWSLSAEEQFYLIWPALLVVASRFSPRAVAGAVVAAGLTSLAAGMVVLPRDPYLAFYMMPFRIFEFAIGAATLLLDWRPPPRVAFLCGALGAGMLGSSFVMFDGNTPWPGAGALVPSVGTALLLVAGRGGSWQLILSALPLRWLGRISYSVYLVHWPLIVFYRYWSLVPPTPVELFVLFAASILLGALLYVAVEQFFRVSAEPKQFLKARGAAMSFGGMLERALARRQGKLFAVFLTVPATAACFGAAVIMWDGFPERMKRDRVQQQSVELSFAGDLCNSSRSRCGFGAPTSSRIVYLLGDSHALNLVYGLDVLFKEHGIRGITFYDHGCLFLYGTTRFQRGVPDQACAKNVAQAFDTVARDRHPVILAGSYGFYVRQIGDAGARDPFYGVEQHYVDWIEERFRRSLQFINAHERRVVVVAESYNAGIDVGKCFITGRSTSSEACVPSSLAAAARATQSVDKMIDRLHVGFPTVTAIDPKPAFCRSGNCTVVESGIPYFRDQTHLTNEGSTFLVRQLGPRLQQALRIAR